MQKILRRLHGEVPLRIDAVDQQGTVVASTYEERIGMASGDDCVRLPVPGQALDIAVEGSGPWAKHVAKLTLMLLQEQDKPAQERDWLRSLLCGDTDSIGKVNIHAYLPARVILIRVDDTQAEAVSKMVKKAFPGPDQCLSCVMDNRTVALVVPQADQDREDCVQLAQAILDTMENELDVDGTVGVSALARDIGDIPEACRQAECALDTGAALARRGSIRVYDDMILERMVYALSEDMRRSFVSRLQDGEGKDLLDSEMIHTAEAFLDTGLNLSETARRLYIHRNTLIYRLDKIQKIIGLDLRNFHEATVFRVLTMASHRETAGSA